MKRIVSIFALVVLAALTACENGSSAAPDEDDEPTVAESATPGAIRTPPESPGGPDDPDALAETVATALATIYANDDANTGIKYAEDVLKTTGCAVEESTVAFKKSARSLEQRARAELIKDLRTNDEVTAFASASARVTKDIEPTIGDKKGSADLVGVVVALFCRD